MPDLVTVKDETVDNMLDMSSDFASLRVSALQKASRISCSVDKVTIGPDSTANDSRTENIENERNSCNISGGNGANALPTTPTNSPSSMRSSLTFSIKKILLENEVQRREEVRKAMERRKQHMENSKMQMQVEMMMMRTVLAVKREQEKAEELARLEAEEEHLAQQTEIRRKHEQQLQAQRIQERKEKLEREAEEQRKMREHEELVERIAPLRMSFREKCRDIGTLLKPCKHRNSAAVILVPLANKLKELSQKMELINEKTRSGDISTTDVNFAENIVKQSEDILSLCRSEIGRIDALYEEEIARREFEMRQAEAQAHAEAARVLEANKAQQAVQEQFPQSPETLPESSQIQNQTEDKVSVEPVVQSSIPLPATPPNEGNAVNPENLASATDSSSVETAAEETEGCSVHESFLTYMNTHLFITNYRANYREIVQSASLKKFRLECQKAINIPINAITGTKALLKDKYETLRSLLMGKSSPNVTQHPQGVAFCKNVLAEKIVSQGETLISSKPEMAFPIAAVAVALWNDYPDFGELLLAHLGHTCPYTIPVFLPRHQAQTDEDYYRSLGYKYSANGVVETRNEYLTRMSGLMRLYAAIIVTRQRNGVTKPHPHGIQNAWRWLAITLNIEPQPDLSAVCATLIFDVLQVAGCSLWQVYPKQFPKMLMLLATQYFSQMRSDADIDGGPMSRLEQFLKNCVTNKSISAPKGQLPVNFW